MTIEKIDTPQQMQRVEALAREIWQEHYTPIIGQAQVEYMLETFQTAAAMLRQLGEGYRYYLLKDDGEAVGYMAVRPESGQLFLSKFYVKAARRGRGYGRAALAFLTTLAAEQKLQKIVLTVNRNNTLALKAYAKLGFVNVGEVVQEIGKGFVMDDYKMEKRLP
ncbi:GNAT family N-acetyltransferase [Sulfurimonas sp. HSL3-7]|uniref:GNAT family N-acetyltransferase n=1 Tax=Sulfonitrofixus jiaomeiensis TaxID=3131938 RepID=UPI0031F7E1E6